MEHKSSFNKWMREENPFDFTDYLKKQKEDDEIDLGLFLELAEENKTIYNQVAINTLVEDTERLKIGFFTIGYFTLGEDGEIDTNRFFKVYRQNSRQI